MSADRIIGIAVLNEETNCLYVACGTHATNRCDLSSITVYEPSKGQVHGPHPHWAIVRRGDVLDVTPSLHIKTLKTGECLEQELFHNAGAWSVKFVIYDKTKFEEPYDQWLELNRELLYKWRAGDRSMQ